MSYWQTLVFNLHDCRLTNVGATWENAVGSRNMQLSFEAFSKTDGSFFDITATAVEAEVPDGVPYVQIKENESARHSNSCIAFVLWRHLRLGFHLVYSH